MRIDNNPPLNLLNDQGLQQRPNSEKQEVVESETLSKNDVQRIVETFNEFMQPLRTDLKFQFHDQLHEYYVTVVDPVTSEVIKEIPPRKLLDMYAAMAEYMGILVDEKI